MTDNATTALATVDSEAEIREYLRAQIATLEQEIQDLQKEHAYIQRHGNRKPSIPGRIEDPDYDCMLEGPVTVCDECGYRFHQEYVRPWRRNDAWEELLLCKDNCLPKAVKGEDHLLAYEKMYPGRPQ